MYRASSFKSAATLASIGSTSTCAQCSSHSHSSTTANKPKTINYNVDSTLWSDELNSKFVQLNIDEGTQEFLDECKGLSFSLWRHWFHSWSKTLLLPFVSVTGINGLLQRGQMHVASTAQFSKLLGTSAAFEASPGPQFDSLLDIGAGDGNVTSRLAPLFKNVFATEASTVMSWRLYQRGYKSFTTITLDSDPALLGPFDVISCLNVLDRCEKPKTLLLDMKKRLKPNTGRLILAIVLPFRPYVEFASNPESSQTKKPIETVKLSGTCFEQWAEDLVEKVVKPCGFSVEAISRSPYLCHGDYYKEYYLLDDLLLVLKPVE